MAAWFWVAEPAHQADVVLAEASHRPAEAALVDQIRQALGADRFDQAFAAGARLSQREAVTVAQSRHGAGTQAS